MQNSNEKSKECCKEFHEKDTKNINSFINEECDCPCHKPSVEVSKRCNSPIDDRGNMVVDFYCTKCKKSLSLKDINNYKGY